MQLSSFQRVGAEVVLGSLRVDTKYEYLRTTTVQLTYSAISTDGLA